MFAPHQYGSIIISDIGALLWLAGVAGSIYKFGFWDVFRLYLVPYLWCVTSLYLWSLSNHQLCQGQPLAGVDHFLATY